jgi:hypothetical protein
VLDSIIFERIGIPAAAICTEPFIRSGKAMAATYGKEDYPFVVIPHPIGNTDHVVLDQWVEDAYQNIKKLLVV